MVGQVVTITLGRVAVDSGHIMVVDPCYVLPEGKNTGKYWDDFMAKATKNDNWNADQERPGDPGIQFIDDLAVAVPSGMGDGFYLVTAEVEHHGIWGWRTNSITVHFQDPDEEESDDEEQPEDES
jgi:hypothetical protein